MLWFPTAWFQILSNDPAKVESNFFGIRQRCFSPQECINLQEGRLRDKMHLHAIFKGFSYVLKDFNQSQKFKAIAKKRLQSCIFPT